jgi:hypothetical protein
MNKVNNDLVKVETKNGDEPYIVQYFTHEDYAAFRAWAMPFIDLWRFTETVL